LNLLGKDESSIKYVSDRLGHDSRYSVDASKILRELGFKPEISWEIGLAETISWYQENESWWRALSK
jgi:dTDP-glucose 4,6-dehydratase